MITPVGAPYYDFFPYNVGENQFSVAPTEVGDLLVVVTNIGGGHATALSGGGVTTWKHLVGPEVTGFTLQLDLWMGVVTAAGPSTVTATIAGSSVVNMYVGQQFTGGTTWLLDKAGAKANASSAKVTWPTLVPAGPNELYVGFGVSVEGPVVNSQSAGYAMPLAGTEFIYDTSVTGSQSPTCGNAVKSTSWTVGALIIAE